jgi:tetratricopeptide (TPR) repeat protein
MTRIICVTLVIMAMGEAFTQNIVSDSTQYYLERTINNFKELGVDWDIDPAARGLFENGLNSLKAGDQKSALKLFSEVIDIDSSFLPAYYFRHRCYALASQRNSKYAAACNNDFHHVASQLPESNVPFLDLWNTYATTHERRRPTGASPEVAPRFFLFSTYLKENRSYVSTESFNLIKKSASALLSGRPANALAFNNTALKLDSSICGLYMKALIVKSIGQHDSAFYFYSKCFSRDESIIEVRENLAKYELLLNNRPAVLMHVNFLNNLKPNSLAMAQFCARLKMEVADYDGAIFNWSKILQRDPANYYCLRQRAICNFRIGNYHEALKDLYTAGAIIRDDLDVYLEKSENYLRLGDSTQCIKVLYDAKKYFTISPALDFYTADKLVEVNRVSEAQALLNQASKDFSVQANTIQCKIYWKRGKVDKAFAELDKLISTDGEQVQYLFLRARLYMERGEKEKAKSDLEKLVKGGYEPATSLFQKL